MKKQNILTMALLLAILGFASCGSNTKPQKANLKTQEDSLNYALGIAISEDIRMNTLQGDTAETTIASLIEKIEENYNDDNTAPEYKTGIKIGNMIKEQKKIGLVGDSTLTFNEELFRSGLTKGLRGDTTGITGPQAMVFFQTTMQKKQLEKMQMNTPAPAPADSIK